MNTYKRLVIVATVQAFFGIVLGAYVRLSDAGLGCPDWPGCYGHIGAPQTAAQQARAVQAFPDKPIEVHKAWKEMIHRYAAGILGLLVLAIAVLAWKRRAQIGDSPALATFLLVLIIFQALLGMWTVTLLLKPVIVTTHLIGGMMTLALLVWLALRANSKPLGGEAMSLRAPALLAPHEVDRAAVDERQDPRRGLRALGNERARAPPEAEEGFLDCVLRERLVPQDPVRQAVGDPSDPVVELRQGGFLRARDERDERFVGEVSEIAAAHRSRLGS